METTALNGVENRAGPKGEVGKLKHEKWGWRGRAEWAQASVSFWNWRIKDRTLAVSEKARQGFLP